MVAGMASNVRTRGAAGTGSRLHSAIAAVGAPTLSALAALLAIVVPMPAAVSGAAGSSQPTTPGSQTPSGAPVAQPAPAGRYRVVGCRSRAGGAYLHGPRRRAVAIGFDDGPAPDTGAFVSMLERAHARATFFMIGEEVHAPYGKVLLRELRDGDVLGDHSYTHPDLSTSGDVRGQLQHTIGAIRALSGYTPCVFRPPYGDYDGSVVRTARSLGLATVLWNVDPRDWARPGTAAIKRIVLGEVQPGSIIISHDGGGPRGETLAAYPGIIAGLRARGYRILTIPELLGWRPVYRPCVRLCAGIGVPRSALPRDAIIERAA